MSGEESPFPSECDYCGTSLKEEVRYPTTTIDMEDGDIEIFTFCSEECKEQWLTEQRDGSNKE